MIESISQNLKNNFPLQNQCTLDTNTGMPSDNLDPIAIQLISALGSCATKVSQVIATQDKAVFAAIQQGISKANEEAGSRPQKVLYFICQCTVMVVIVYLLK